MNHSKKHHSLAEQQERHDGMIQRRTPASLAEVPRVPMFPGVVVAPELPSKSYSFAALGLDSLGCEGDEHINQKAMRDLPQIPVFVAAAEPAPSPTPAELPQPAPGPAATARWALWSDGTLDLRTPDGWVHLGAEQTRELQRYLAKMGGQG